MRVCYSCKRGFLPGQMFCPHDGSFLFFLESYAQMRGSMASVRLLCGCPEIQLSFGPVTKVAIPRPAQQQEPEPEVHGDVLGWLLDTPAVVGS